MLFKRFKNSFLLFALILAIDMATKCLTHFLLPVMGDRFLWYPYGGIGVFQNFLGIEFSISHMTNRGAVWGAFSAYQSYLVLVRCMLLIGLIAYFYYNRESRLQTPLTLIISGAFGNILDYFLYGHVVDMLHFVFFGYDYPVFNIADSAICIGIIWMAIDAFWCDRVRQVKKQKGPGFKSR
ncbi:MAG: Lipoprotein signal peptidase [Chlamydiales bacterium]|jgi:signal peptidase II|nr:Lipoprotein signal peptidase [Chlamydiales bacterium]